MMKKIGIITFHRSHNCGSMLESYAMQQIVKKMGYENEIINFSSNGQRNMYNIFSKINGVKKFVRNILLLPFYPVLKRHYNNYEDFLKKNMKISDKDLSENDDLKNLNENYDCFIAGSDQIWNITIPDYNSIYFLEFADYKKKKIAYAPSFGSKKIQKYSAEPEYYRELIKNFDFLSVREKNGKKWIKELCDIDVNVVLDPTLLLDREEYEILENDSLIKDKYIFYYCPRFNKKMDKFVKKVAKKYNLKVIVWSSKDYYLKTEWRNGFKMAYQQDPSIYLNLIHNAELVMTTSFHGTIFSSIYKKNFWILKNGGMFEDDDRVKTLIEQLSLEDRLILPDYDEKFDYLKKCDYEKYDINLPVLRELSKQYLADALNSKKDINEE